LLTRAGMLWTVCSLLAAPRSAVCAQAAEPTVIRAQGAEACPDASTLTAQIAAIGGLADAFSRSGYTVVFAHADSRGGTFSAHIRPRDSAGERLLEAPGESCAPLAKATAVTLALLLDNEARSQPAPVADESAVVPTPAPVEEPPAAPAAAKPPPGAPPHSAPRRIDRAALALGGAGLFGVVRTLTPALLASLALTHGRLQYRAGALWALPYTRELGPGSLEAHLASGSLHVCTRALASRLLQLSACSGAYAGVLRVEAQGFTVDRTRHQAWLAIPIELTLATLWSPVGLSLSASALFPLRRYDFSVDGLG
jgi:hypothetical protein